MSVLVYIVHLQQVSVTQVIFERISINNNQTGTRIQIKHLFSKSRAGNYYKLEFTLIRVQQKQQIKSNPSQSFKS